MTPRPVHFPNCDCPIEIYDTYISLPSGSQLALDGVRSFTPNQEFWQLWRDDKLAVKSTGISIKREPFGWRGYVRDDAQGFSDTKADQHQHWTDKARDLAEDDTVLPVVIAHAAIDPNVKIPCKHTGEFEVVAKVCRNATFQIRLRCDTCDRQTQGAIKWEYFSSDFLIPAIAHAIQVDRVTEKTLTSPLFEELKGVDWV